MTEKNNKNNGNMMVGVVTQTVIIMISSVMMYALLDFIHNRIVLGNVQYDPIYAVGMLLPMGLVMGAISYFSAKAVYRHVLRLTAGIKHVASGNFSIHLDTNKGGPLKEAYINFNKMVTELNSVQILRNDFINDFSHEFKTPITSINGFATLLLEEAVSDEERLKYLKIIAEESQRLASLANSSMLLSKLESQQFISDKKIYSLDEQIKQCAIILSREWDKKKIEFSAELEKVQYYGNYDLMQHVWINLIVNAIKFTPEHGGNNSYAKKENAFIKFSVSDTGKGMSEEEMNQIFTKYYQGDSSHSNTGLGLGLSIVNRIVDLCGGKIEVKSTINEGSTFTLFLPYSG